MSVPRLLVIAPHPDDESLGAGGVIARAADAGVSVTVLTVSAHMPPLYTSEVHQQTLGEAKRAHELLGVERSVFFEIPAVSVKDKAIHELNGDIERVVEEVQPNVILGPAPDRHADHRAVFEAMLVAARPVRVARELTMLAVYETLSETHWTAPHLEPNFQPNWTIDITDTLDRKLDAVGCYESQIPPFPGSRSIGAVRALAIFRGTQAGFAAGESFQVLRMKAPVEALL